MRALVEQALTCAGPLAALVGGRRLARLGALLLLLLVSTGAKAQSFTQDDAKAIYDLVTTGRNVDAVAKALEFARKATGTAREPAFQYAAWTCVVLYDTECAKQALEISDAIIKAGPPDAVSGAIYGYSLLIWSFVETMTTPGNASTRVAAGSSFPDGVVNPFLDPVLYADLQILAARRAVNDGRLDAARIHLEKALASTLSIRFLRFDAPRLLVRIGMLLIETYDFERAIRILVNAEFSLQSIPPDSLLRIEYLELRGALAAIGTRFDIAAADYQTAISEIQKLQLSPQMAQYYLATLFNDWIGVEVAQSNLPKVQEALQRHPMHARKDAIIKRGYFADASEFYFSIAEEFAQLTLGGKTETSWDKLWSQPVRWTSVTERVVEAEVMARAATGLSELRKGNRVAAAQHLIDAGRERIRHLQSLYSTSMFVAPMPNWTDRVLLHLAAGASALISEKPDYDFLLSAHALLARNLQSMADDVLAVLAVQQTDAKRRVVQTYQTIEHQRAAWERNSLELLTKRLWSGEQQQQKEVDDERMALLSTASEFLRSRSELRSAIVGGAGANNVASVTTLPTVQRALRPDEAAILHIGAVGQIVRICITDRSVFIAKAPLDIASVTKDAALLQAALTASHDASPVLDSQYPVKEALRVRDVLFGGLDSCLSGQRRIYMVGIEPALVGVPPAALLEEAPPEKGEGYDLRRAKWLVRKFAFVRVSSLGVLVAAKSLGNKRSVSLDYLGIGEPQLKAPAKEPSNSEAFASRDASKIKADDLRNLIELPESGEEVQKVAGLFAPGRSRVLVKESATEEAFRLQPLSEFDVLHFATHGLVREEIAGLSEPALIMTPELGKDALNDGILTATQIAALPLRARLVVLSACNSARYEAQVISRGIQGLSAAFAVAGTPAMVASLWPAESRVARDIMVGMFKALQSSGGPGVSDALARSTREFLDSDIATPFLHPRFWAAFVTIGDGAIGLSSGEDQSARLLAPYEQVSTGERTELLSGAVLGGDYVVSGIGKWNGKKFPGVIERRKPSGEVVWTIVDAAFAVPHVATSKLDIFAAGYMSPDTRASKETGSASVLQRLGPDGKQVWLKRFDRVSNENETTAAVHAYEDGRIAVLIGDFGYGYTARQSIRLVVVDREGRESQSFADLMPAGEARYQSGVLASNAESLFVGLNSPARQSTDPRHLRVNSLDLKEACWEADYSDVTLIDRATWTVKRRIEMPRFRLAQALPFKEGWILIGELRPGCGLHTKAIAYVVMGGSPPELLWLDGTPFTTTGDAARIRNGSLEIYGRSVRSVSIKDYTLAEKKVADYTAQDHERANASTRFGDEALVARELYAVKVNIETGVESRDFLGAGLPIAPAGIIESGPTSAIYGTIGLRPLWISRNDRP